MSLTSIDLGLKELLRDPDSRHEFFKEITQDEVAEQIRELRKKRGLNQSDLGQRIDMQQSAVSRIEQADYSSWTFKTLMRIAAALDARWRLVLQPCEEAVKEFELLQEPSIQSSEQGDQARNPNVRTTSDDEVFQSQFEEPSVDSFGDAKYLVPSLTQISAVPESLFSDYSSDDDNWLVRQLETTNRAG